MTIAELALAISGVSVLISAGSLAWKIASKFIDRLPRLKVSHTVATFSNHPDRPVLMLMARNLGLGSAKLTGVEAMRRDHGRVVHLTSQPFALFPEMSLDMAQFPKRIDAGETAVFWFEPAAGDADGLDQYRLALRDGYDLRLLVSRKALRKGQRSHQDRQAAAALAAMSSHHVAGGTGTIRAKRGPVPLQAFQVVSVVAGAMTGTRRWIQPTARR